MYAMTQEQVSRALLNAVINNDLSELQRLLNEADLQYSARHLLRFEFSLKELMEAELKQDERCPKLLDYEIRTLSALHCCALLGRLDLLLELLDRDVPVDTPLASGTTMLHLAAFSGMTALIKALIDIYKADRFRADRYGWTALHYASTEGQVECVRALLSAGLEVDARDQDGTTAAFRADINGHKEVVKILCEHGPDDELLNVVENVTLKDTDSDRAEMYSKVNKGSKEDRSSSASCVPDLSKFSDDGRVPSLVKNGVPVLPPRTNRSQSEPAETKAETGDVKNVAYGMSCLPGGMSGQSKSFPTRASKNLGRNTVRRLLRKELESAMCGDYMEPALCLGLASRNDAQKEEEEDIRIGGGDGIGIHTLKGIMREELDRFRRESLGELAREQRKSQADGELKPEVSNDAHDDGVDYMSLADLPAAPAPPTVSDMDPKPPPLPPRNNSVGEAEMRMNTLTLKKNTQTARALNECVNRLAPRIGNNWKKLARAFPLAADNAMLEKRIKAIEKSHSKSPEKQALACLVEWRINQGGAASIQDLMKSLRKAGLVDLLPVVDKIYQQCAA